MFYIYTYIYIFYHMPNLYINRYALIEYINIF